MAQQKINPTIASYIPFVKGIAATIGSHCEVVLHDFSKLPQSIVAIENGHVTGRDFSSPIPEKSLALVKAGNTEENVLNYGGKTFNGQSLKSSTLYIKDQYGAAIGCFCINIDTTALEAAKKVIEEIAKVTSHQMQMQVKTTNHVSDILSNMVNRTIESIGKPVAYMTKEEKVLVVKTLSNDGAFLVKGAIDFVADALSVSRYTIYNYMDESKC